jgi:alkanesulfonate monooxygenase SsuD/methylene tetrahydromethanopterin reductase-like flavin-dependent oxidoreductase (luciferase family)
VKFGLLYEIQRAGGASGEVDYTRLYEETLEQCVAADEAGFDYVWFVEHHFLTGFSGNPASEVIISALARLTNKIRLGFGVVILPNHHPVQVAERVAMIDHISGGRVDMGTGRSSAFEQTGLGIDPRDTRDLWDESVHMIPKIWGSGDSFEWDGDFYKVPKRNVLPKPYQQPHPPIWLACTQPASFELAAERGIGVLSFGSGAPAGMKKHIDAYRQNIENSEPVGAFINNQWANFTIGHCGDNNEEARELATHALREFFGPDKPYTQDRKEVFAQLLEAWGGAPPEHLQASFGRAEAGSLDLAGGGSPRHMLAQLGPDVLCERGVIIAGDPDSCIECVRQHEAAGVDQVLTVMQTTEIPHEKAISSIKLYGKEVISAFR